MSCEDPREVIDPRRIVFRVLCGPSLLAAGPHLIDFMKSIRQCPHPLRHYLSLQHLASGRSQLTQRTPILPVPTDTR